MTRNNQLIGSNELCRTLLNATPLPMFVVDQDLQIFDLNSAAAKLLGSKPKLLIRRRSGEVLHCIHSTEAPGGCGCSKACTRCAVRKSVRATVSGKRLVRERAEMEWVDNSAPRQVQLLVSTTPFRYRGKQFALLVLEDITELLSLRKLLPICGKCRKVRDDQDYWHRLDHYLATNLQLDITHGLCPDCIQQARALTPVLSGQRRARAAD